MAAASSQLMTRRVWLGILVWGVPLAGSTVSSPARITFLACARKRIPAPAPAKVLNAFFSRHPDMAAAELLAPNAYAPASEPGTYACELSEVSMLGISLRPKMRVTLSHAPSSEGRTAKGAWLVRADELQLGEAMEGLCFAAETLISWEGAQEGGTQVCGDAQMRVCFDAPRGFRAAARGPVERIGSAALSAVLAASLTNSLRSTASAVERWVEEQPAAGDAAKTLPLAGTSRLVDAQGAAAVLRSAGGSAPSAASARGSKGSAQKGGKVKRQILEAPSLLVAVARALAAWQQGTAAILAVLLGWVRTHAVQLRKRLVLPPRLRKGGPRARRR